MSKKLLNSIRCLLFLSSQEEALLYRQKARGKFLNTSFISGIALGISTNTRTGKYDEVK